MGLRRWKDKDTEYRGKSVERRSKTESVSLILRPSSACVLDAASVFPPTVCLVTILSRVLPTAIEESNLWGFAPRYPVKNANPQDLQVAVDFNIQFSCEFGEP